MKGTESKTINIVIGLIITIAIMALFLALFLPAITATEKNISCVGMLRNVASVIGDMTGRNICPTP
jgi:competence protein ComGC